MKLYIAAFLKDPLLLNCFNPLAAMANQFPYAELIYCNFMLNSMYLKYFADRDCNYFFKYIYISRQFQCTLVLVDRYNQGKVITM